MKKKDFEAIGQALADFRSSLPPCPPNTCPAPSQACPCPTCPQASYNALCRSVADTLARQSGTFNRVRFLRSTGMDGKAIRQDAERLGALIN